MLQKNTNKVIHLLILLRISLICIKISEMSKWKFSMTPWWDVKQAKFIKYNNFYFSSLADWPCANDQQMMVILMFLATFRTSNVDVGAERQRKFHLNFENVKILFLLFLRKFHLIFSKYSSNLMRLVYEIKLLFFTYHSPLIKLYYLQTIFILILWSADCFVTIEDT